MMDTIVRVHLSNPPGGPALIYERDGAPSFQEIDLEVEAEIATTRSGYFRATLLHGQWILGEAVPDQSWGSASPAPPAEAGR